MSQAQPIWCRFMVWIVAKSTGSKPLFISQPWAKPYAWGKWFGLRLVSSMDPYLWCLCICLFFFFNALQFYFDPLLDFCKFFELPISLNSFTKIQPFSIPLPLKYLDPCEFKPNTLEIVFWKLLYLGAKCTFIPQARAPSQYQTNFLIANWSKWLISFSKLCN